MSKHTPAPWKIEHDNSDQSSGGQWFDVGPARVWYSYRSPLDVVDQAKADADLISAAPEMLAALKGFVKAWSEGTFLLNGHDQLKACRDAIQKAEGLPQSVESF